MIDMRILVDSSGKETLQYRNLISVHPDRSGSMNYGQMQWTEWKNVEKVFDRGNTQCTNLF